MNRRTSDARIKVESVAVCFWRSCLAVNGIVKGGGGLWMLVVPGVVIIEEVFERGFSLILFIESPVPGRVSCEVDIFLLNRLSFFKRGCLETVMLVFLTLNIVALLR